MAWLDKRGQAPAPVPTAAPQGAQPSGLPAPAGLNDDGEPSGLPESSAGQKTRSGLWGVAQSTGAPSGLTAADQAADQAANQPANQPANQAPSGQPAEDPEGETPPPAPRWVAEAAQDDTPSGLPQAAPAVQRWSDDPTDRGQ